MKHYDWDNILQYMDEDMLAEALAAGKRAKAGTGRRVYRTLLIAAIIASFMVTAAFAAGLLDFRALLLEDTLEINGQEFSKISLTQPQAVPEETESAGTQENALKDTDELEEKLAASKAAWAEWEEYMDERTDREVPDSMKFVLGKGGVLQSTEKEDGTVELLLKTREGEERGTVSPLMDTDSTFSGSMGRSKIQQAHQLSESA